MCNFTIILYSKTIICVTVDGLAENVEKVSLKYVDNNTCKARYQAGTVRKLPDGLVDHQLCALGELRGNQRQDTCQGDSGYG